MRLSWRNAVCRIASISLYSIVIIAADVIVTMAISGSSWAAQTERQKMAKWKNRDAEIQEVNMTCIISTFADNWKRIARLALWNLYSCACGHNIGAGGWKCSTADLSLLKNICEVNGVRKAVPRSQAWRKVRTRGTIPTFMTSVTPHGPRTCHEQ